jgi:hypothetical protein
VDPAKGNRQHPCSDAHRSVVLGYRSWREAEERAAEDVTRGYPTEEADYWNTHRRPTLKAYLLRV